MTETIPAPPDTQRDNRIPPPPAATPLVEFDIQSSDAPIWMKAFYREWDKSRAEERKRLSRIERNQNFQISEMRNIRTEQQAIRERLDALEDWRRSSESDGSTEEL